MLKAESLDLPAGVEFKCVEVTATQAWLVLPPKPSYIGSDIAAVEERLAAFDPGCRVMCI